MCMDRLYKTVKVPSSGIGWKVFGTTENGSLEFAVQNDNSLKRGVWMKADTSFRVGTLPWNPCTYMSGFHVYLERPQKLMVFQYSTNRVIKVKFRGGRHVGMQNGIRVVVADELFVPKNKTVSKSKTAKKGKSK